MFGNGCNGSDWLHCFALVALVAMVLRPRALGPDPSTSRRTALNIGYLDIIVLYLGVFILYLGIFVLYLGIFVLYLGIFVLDLGYWSYI